MLPQFLKLLGGPSADTYRRAHSLILVNGLAEQGESWYLNRSVWQKHFDVHSPGVLVYDGEVLQERLAKRAINIDFLSESSRGEYLDRFVQSPPYHLGSRVQYWVRRSRSSMRLVISREGWQARLVVPFGDQLGRAISSHGGGAVRACQGLVESTSSTVTAPVRE